jgi:uncharacterized surface protein with fasciclin (FAS1) repeats
VGVIKNRVLRRCAASIGCVLLLAACSKSDGYAGSEIEFSNGAFEQTLVEAQITSLFAQIYESVASSVITEQGGLKTLFAPNNAAVEKYLADNSETVEGLIAKPELALSLVLGHILENGVSATELLNKNGESLTMLNGSIFTIDTSSGSTQLVSASGNMSTLIAIDLESTNGVVHIVDSVLTN